MVFGWDFGFEFSAGDGFLVKVSGRWINSDNKDESDEESSSGSLGFRVFDFGVLDFEVPAVSFPSFLWVIDLGVFFFLLVVGDVLELDAAGIWQLFFFGGPVEDDETDEAADETDGVSGNFLGLKMLFDPLVFPGLLLVVSPLHLKQIRLFWSLEETTPQLGCIALWQSGHFEFLGIKSF